MGATACEILLCRCLFLWQKGNWASAYRLGVIFFLVLKFCRMVANYIAHSVFVTALLIIALFYTIVCLEAYLSLNHSM